MCILKRDIIAIRYKSDSNHVNKYVRSNNANTKRTPTCNQTVTTIVTFNKLVLYT